MRKSVFIGGGLGLLVLALVAVSLWLAADNAQHGAAQPISSKATRSDAAALSAGSGAPGQLGNVDAASQPRSSQASQERKRRLAQMRAEFNALRAQGVNAPPERMRAVVDELEALSPPGLDHRYYQTLRNMLEASGRIQVLNKELQSLIKSTQPKDVARQKAIMNEMRTLGERVTAEASNLQAYAPKVAAGAKTP